MAATATKICTICNTDCADRPRVKDEFGRYACKACLEKQEAQAAAKAKGFKSAPPKASEDDEFDLRSAAMMEAKSAAMDLPEAQCCPKCNGFMPDDQRLCMRCGYDRKRGAKVMTKVEKAPKEKAVSQRAREGRSPVAAVIGCWLLGLVPVGAVLLGFFGPVPETVGTVPALGLSLLASGITLGILITVTVFQFVDGYSGYGFGTIGAFACAIGAVVAAVSSIVLGMAGPLLALVFLVMALILFVRTIYWACAITERGWLRVLGTCYGAYIALGVVQGFLVGYGAIEQPWKWDADEPAAATSNPPRFGR